MDDGNENWPAGEMPGRGFTQKPISPAALKVRMAFLHLWSLMFQVPGGLVPTASTQQEASMVCVPMLIQDLCERLLIPLFQTKVLKWSNQAASGRLSEELRRLKICKALPALLWGHFLITLGCRCHEYKILSGGQKSCDRNRKGRGRAGTPISERGLEGWEM